MTTVSSWLTRGSDQSKLFQAQPAITTTASSGASGTNPITIDKTVTYQSMIGFGAALTDSAAYTIWSMPSAARSTLMTELFDPVNGYGISCLRLTIGACDFSRGPYTYDDDGGSADPSLANFAITHDLDAVVPLAKAALALNPGLKFIASCWSPPAWMKNGGLNGGTLNPTYYSAYAQYLVKYCQAYAAQGVPIWGISVANEPENGTSAYPSTPMTAAQQVTLIGQYVGPAFTSAGITTKILAYDHNWNDTAYPETIFADATAGPYVDGVAWHAYAGDVSAQTTVHNAYPAKNTYFTEITASQPGSFQGDLQWHCRNITLGAPNNWARLTTHWNLALNENNGPLNGGYTSGQGLIHVNSSTNAVTRYGPYYAVVHSSAKVKPGAQRIACTNPGTGYVVATAYLNPDGSRVAILECDAQSAQTFNVIEGGQQFTATMQPGDVATYVFPASTPAAVPTLGDYGIYAAPITPVFTNSFWTNLPDVSTAPLHPNSAAIVAELVNDLNAFGGTAAFNAHQFNTSVIVAPAGTPRYTIGFFDAQRKGALPDSFAAVLQSVPVPAGALASTGSDGELTIIDQSTTPATIWEFWQWAHYDTQTTVTLPNSTQTAVRPAGYSACWGGKTTADGPGYFTNGLGASASECAIVGGVIGIREAEAAFTAGHAALGHALNMAVNSIGPASKVQWPAQNSDGSSSTALLQYGQMFRLDPTLTLTVLGLTNIGYMVARTLQHHPIIITDQAGAVSVIAESPNQIVAQGGVDPWAAMKAPLTADQDYLVLKNFPWSHMQALMPNWGEYPGNPAWTNSGATVFNGASIVATATSSGTANTIVTAINSNSSGSQYTVTGTANITRATTGAVIATGTSPANAAAVVAALNTAYAGGTTPVTSVKATGTTSPIQVPGLAAGSWKFSVQAVNGSGASAQSATSAAVTIAATPATPSFVTMANNALVVAGTPTKMTGINVYGAILSSNVASNIDSILASLGSPKANGAGNLIRFWAFQRGMTVGGVRNWTAMDRVIAAAKAHGFRLIPVLLNSGANDECPSVTGPNQYWYPHSSTEWYHTADWYESGYKTELEPEWTVTPRAWVAEIAAHYKNEPTIAMWEIHNEAEFPNAPTDGAAYVTVLHNYWNDLGGVIKAADPNHLVTTSVVGTGQNGTSGGDFQTAFNTPNVDVVQVHDYTPQGTTLPGDQYNGLGLRITQAHNLGKAIIIGECGNQVPSTEAATSAARAALFQQKITTDFTNGVAAWVAWSYVNPPGGTPYDIGAGDPALSVVFGNPA